MRRIGGQAHRPNSKLLSNHQMSRSLSSLLTAWELTLYDWQLQNFLLASMLIVTQNAQNILRGIDHEFVRTSLNIFESMLAHFPFVTLAPNPDPYRMINERPFTTLAICVIASPARPNVQQRLAQCFRQALSQKAVVQGDRNLDLLLGLLTYLAWPHHFATTHRVYPLLHLLAGIAADLGYYEQSPMSNTINVADGARERAFVGCFHLCCGLSIVGFTRPSPLRWADNLGHWAQSLTSMGMQSTDRQLAGIVDLSRALQDFDEILRTAAGARLATSAGLIELQAKSALQRLRALRSTYPVLGGALAFSAMSLHVYRRVLQFNPTPDTATLFQCACSVKEYLDDVLARPPILMHRLATVEWTHLLEILMLMAKISNSASDAGGWEAGALTSMLQPEAILDSLCAHMSKAPTDDPLAPRQDSQLHWLGSVCENIKQRLLRQPINGLANGGVGGHGFRPVNDPYQSRLPAQQDYRAAAHGKHDRSDVLANGVWAEPLVTELSST